MFDDGNGAADEGTTLCAAASSIFSLLLGVRSGTQAESCVDKCLVFALFFDFSVLLLRGSRHCTLVDTAELTSR